MKKITEELLLLLILLIIIPFSSVYAQWDPEGSEEAILVGRLSHIEGTVSQYLPDEDQWISAEEDAPFGKDDILQSGRDGRAELVIPNNTWIRLDNDTQMHIVSLQADRTHVAIDAGTVRFYNKGSNAIIRVATPFGSVSASSRSSFDIYVDDASVEVIALKGRVSFVHTPDQEEYEVMAGSTSLLAERHRITAGKGTLARDWEIWNNHGTICGACGRRKMEDPGTTFPRRFQMNHTSWTPMGDGSGSITMGHTALCGVPSALESDGPLSPWELG